MLIVACDLVLADMIIVAGTAGHLMNKLDGIEEPDILFIAQLSVLPHFGLIRCEAKLSL
jgi:hypothetical protein